MSESISSNFYLFLIILTLIAFATKKLIDLCYPEPGVYVTLSDSKKPDDRFSLFSEMAEMKRSGTLPSPVSPRGEKLMERCQKVDLETAEKPDKSYHLNLEESYKNFFYEQCFLKKYLKRKGVYL